MTATETATQPTPEQLKAYADQLPDLYKDILAAIQYAQPNRVVGQGVLGGTVRMFLLNKAAKFATTYEQAFAGNTRSHQFSAATDGLTEDDFRAAVENLIGAELLEPEDRPRFPRLLPTTLGERLIALLTGQETPRRQIPELPKPTW